MATPRIQQYKYEEEESRRGIPAETSLSLSQGVERGPEEEARMGRSPCCAKEGLNRGAWTAMEDGILKEYIKIHGEGKWRNLPKRAGLKRCGKSCRLRWLNYLRPDIKRGNITDDEEELIIRLHKLLGNRWSLIAGRLPGRTDNEIKNYWNTTIGKKLQAHQTSISTHRASPKPPQKNSTQSMAARSVTKNPNVVLVRTQARRCTRVVTIPDLPTDQKVRNTDPISDEAPPTASDPIGRTMTPQEVNEPYLVTDLEMDDKFLSEILNIDFSSSSNSDETLLSDFFHEIAFLEPAEGWFQE